MNPHPRRPLKRGDDGERLGVRHDERVVSVESLAAHNLLPRADHQERGDADDRLLVRDRRSGLVELGLRLWSLGHERPGDAPWDGDAESLGGFRDSQECAAVHLGCHVCSIGHREEAVRS